ncbi:MAG TPA: alpha/beta fold hydrolase [Usitatibacter sp.]|nr:alpha/beta fold hydrolase [Usitatibacter sp.]
MLSRLVFAGLLLELLGYATSGAWLHALRGWSVGSVILLAIAVALGVRLAMVAMTMLLAWTHRSPRRSLQFAGALRLLWLEWRALLADNFLYLPLEKLLVRRDPAGPVSRTPVLLVHGFFSNRGYFRTLVRTLDASSGRAVYTGNFSATFATIERFAAELHERIEEVCASSRQPRVILVCHSMGGLAAREYLRVRGGARVERLVTIASPHRGTALATFGMGANARQMARDSEFLRALEAFEGDAGPGVPALSIYTRHDNMVAPQDTSQLPWARNVALTGLGHVGILASRELGEVLLAELRGS